LQKLAPLVQAAGVLLADAVSTSAAMRYVDVNSADPVAPYTSWATAAATIQDAVDAASAGDEISVTNGVYATGGRATAGESTTNRVAVDKPVTLQSIHGSLATIIDGRGLGRCVYLAAGAKLSGFTLTKGVAVYGGGVFCETNAVVSNCVLSRNSAYQPPDYLPWDVPVDVPAGGGAYGGTLDNCTLTDNSAFFIDQPTAFPAGSTGYGGGASHGTLIHCLLEGNGASAMGGGADVCVLMNCTLRDNWAAGGGGAAGCTLSNCILTGNLAEGRWNGGGSGGGASGCTLNNCTLTANSVSGVGESGGLGGGAARCTLNNCIIYFNTAADWANFDWSSSLNYCCTTPLPSSGTGNITNAPLFVDQASGNLRLQSNSPCINAGPNALAPVGPDLDGNPRIKGGTVDMGAYEFQSPTSIISYAWLQQYGLLFDGSADVADPDGDGLNNWQEWRCGTDPTSALSALRLLAPVSGGASVAVTWQSIAGVSYFLERAASLAESPSFAPLASNLPGQPGTTTFTDTNAIRAGPWFYRVGVSTP